MSFQIINRLEWCSPYACQLPYLILWPWSMTSAPKGKERINRKSWEWQNEEERPDPVLSGVTSAFPQSGKNLSQALLAEELFIKEH